VLLLLFLFIEFGVKGFLIYRVSVTLALRVTLTLCAVEHPFELGETGGVSSSEVLVDRLAPVVVQV
jgi:hypothetical protein